MYADENGISNLTIFVKYYQSFKKHRDCIIYIERR